MKSIIYTLISLTILSSSLFPQEKDSLIQLYPGIGDTLKIGERDSLKLFPQFKGFKYAVFYIREKKYLVSNITHQTNGELKDTSIVEGLYKLGILRKKIEQSDILKFREKNKSKSVTILCLTGDSYEGNLEMFNENYLFLNSENPRLLNIPYPYSRYKISSSLAESIAIHNKSYVVPSLGIGATIGFTIGAIIGYTQGVPWGNQSIHGIALKVGAIGGLIGGLVGLGIGIGLSLNDHVIQINSQHDVFQLKNYAQYYYGNDESIKVKYYEVK